jgi:3-dehydroquinate dehydratase/shikimate dehydrogenase
VTYLCAAIFVDDIDRAMRDIGLAAEAGADMVELRIDRFAKPELLDQEAIAHLVRTCALPCIVTCRPTWEGGHSELSDSERLSALRIAAEAGASYVDVEVETTRRLPGASAELNEFPRQTRLLLSAHDFKGRPERLHNLVQEMQQVPAGLYKVVWTARSIRDNIEAFELLSWRQAPTIALCMGEAGLISRILAKKFGAFLTFASLDSAGGTAPGQITVSDMKRLYRWDAINPETRVYGVVAQPVAHSMSPAIHNAAFDATGYNGIYLPLLVNAGYESFKAFMETFVPFEGLHLSGLSVTIPHKENALRYLQERGGRIDPLAERVGAVNTIVIDRAGGTTTLRGTSTDYAAILDSITEKLGITRAGLKDYRVAVLGAGGTGRTAVAALAHYGATVVVYNRTRERADALAEEFNGKTGKVVAADLEKLCKSCCQIFINTTSAGMHPNIEQSPLGSQAAPFSPETLVFDTVYNPMETHFLQQAREAGAKTIGGVEMFVRQAAGQFEMWTGKTAPTAVMREVVEKRLRQ